MTSSKKTRKAAKELAAQITASELSEVELQNTSVNRLAAEILKKSGWSVDCKNGSIYLYLNQNL